MEERVGLGSCRKQWLLAAVGVALVLHTSACPTTEHSGICHYGALPGRWTQSHQHELVPQWYEQQLNKSFPVWQPYCPSCQLKPLLGPYLGAAQPADAVGNTGLLGNGSSLLNADALSSRQAKLRRLGVLLLGDSVDYRILRFFCNAAHNEEPREFTRSGPDELKLQGICSTPKMTVAKHHMSSASLDGPYWNNIAFNPLLSVADGLQYFKKAHGANPDIVLISTNFWDIASIFSAAGMQFKGSVLEHETFPDEFTRAWMRNFTTILSALKDQAPEGTLLAYHTLHVPKLTTDPRMWETDPFLSQHVAQLNAAGRHVAASQHFHIIDMEAMALQLSRETMLIDTTHPGPHFMLQVLNMLLNIEEAHRDVRQQKQLLCGRGWLKRLDRLRGAGLFGCRRRLLS